MKFNCDSCGQRYAISDEKARGKVLKIRCRKCSHVITVRGEPAGAAAKAEPKASAKPEPKAAAKAEPKAEPKASAKPEPKAAPRPRPRSRASREAPALDLEPPEEADRTRMMSASSLQDALAASRAAGEDEVPPEREEKTTMMSLADLDRAREASAASGEERDDEEEGWYAVIGGKQQGPFDDAAFEARLASGRITERTYVWREGMDDWKPVAKVPVLAARLAPAAPEEDHPLDTLAESTSGGMDLDIAVEDSVPGIKVAAPDDDAPADDGRGADDAPEADDAPPARADAEAAGADAEAAGAAARSPDDALDALFEDIPEAAPGEAGGAENALDEAIHDDPFANVPDAPGRLNEPPRENTAMFILASGVNKRRSPVRIAAFVLGFAAVFGGMGFLVLHVGGIKLSSVLPLVHRHVAAGAATPTDAAEAARLRAQLMGAGKTPAKAKVAARAVDPNAGPVVHKEKPKVAALDASQKAALAALYGDKSRGALAIKVSDGASKGPKVDSDKSPIDPQVIAKKIGANQRAFQGCVQQELRRDPTFKGGKVTLTLTVAPSGVVTHAKLDRPDLADSDVGSCITGASKRIVFPTFAGDDPVDFEIPLILSTGN